MPDPLQLNLTSWIVMLLHRFGIADSARIAIYVRAVLETVRHAYPRERPSLVALNPFIREQLSLLESALAERRAEGSAADIDSTIEIDDLPASGPAPSRRLPRGDAGMVARSLEEKLCEERKPIQDLLLHDCVHTGLVDKETAKRFVASMAGRTPEEAERDIVVRLRQVLQDQVREMIRRAKGGPWASPLEQEEMRQDIHHANSVRGVLMLRRQVLKEYQAWENQQGFGRMLGMFAARGRLAR